MTDWRVSDLDAVQSILRGGSVVDWRRLNYRTEAEAMELLRVHRLDPGRDEDRRWMEHVRDRAVAFLRSEFELPIPKPLRQASVVQLILTASGSGHRQLCACIVLKVMHVIHHVESRARTADTLVPEREVFASVEQSFYQAFGQMFATGIPILEVSGGRKNPHAIYLKLLCKRESVAANVYDRLRFRLIVRRPDQVLQVLRYLHRHLLPFNYVVPGQSTNTLIDLANQCSRDSQLVSLFAEIQDPTGADSEHDGNRFSARSYRCINFAVDVPVRLPGAAGTDSGVVSPVGFVQVELQILDRESEQENELGDARHEEYKRRQRAEVARRLKVGRAGASAKLEP